MIQAVNDTIPVAATPADTTLIPVNISPKPVFKPKIFKPSVFQPDTLSKQAIDSSIYDASVNQLVKKKELKKEIVIFPFDNPTIKPVNKKTESELKTFVTTKQIRRDDYLVQRHNFEGTDFITVLLIVLVFNIAWLRIFFGNALILFMKAAFDPKYTARLISNVNPVITRVGFMLNINFIITVSVFLYFLTRFFQMPFAGVNPYIFISAMSLVLAAIYTGRFFILHLAEKIIRNDYFSEYLIILLGLNKIYGLFLILLIILITFLPFHYVEMMIHSGIIAFIIIYLIRILRGFFISIKIRLSLFYFILYICTLEIIPVLLTYKFVNLIINYTGI